MNAKAFLLAKSFRGTSIRSKLPSIVVLIDVPGWALAKLVFLVLVLG